MVSFANRLQLDVVKNLIFFLATFAESMMMLHGGGRRRGREEARIHAHGRRRIQQLQLRWRARESVFTSATQSPGKLVIFGFEGASGRPLRENPISIHYELCAHRQAGVATGATATAMDYFNTSLYRTSRDLTFLALQESLIHELTSSW